jgi:CheY-like chemotaxis protein
MKAFRGKSRRLMAQILIVEGHTSIREYLRSVLERLGHQVTEARDGVRHVLNDDQPYSASASECWRGP